SAAVRMDSTQGHIASLQEAHRFSDAARVLLHLCEETAATGEAPSLREAQQDAERAYQILKARLLQMAVEGQLPVHDMDMQLRSASILRRALDQLGKASLAMRAAALPPATAAG